jgi:hypothetical protein
MSRIAAKPNSRPKNIRFVDNADCGVCMVVLVI